MKALMKNVRSESFWVRLGFMLLFTIALELALPLLIVLVWLQFIYRFFMGKLQDDLYRFISSSTQFIYQAYGFLSYQTDTKPFPFNDWPAPKQPQPQDDSDVTDKPEQG